MSGNMRSANRTEVDTADEERIEASDLDESVTLQEGVWVPVFTVKATRSTGYMPGYGVRNRNLAEGFADMDLVDDQGTPADVACKYRYAIYESEDLDNLLYKVNLGKDTQFRSAVSSERTDKPIVHQRAPGASQDRVLALEIKPTSSANDGASPSRANSSSEQGLPYASV